MLSLSASAADVGAVQRAKALAELMVLDTPDEQSFDDRSGAGRLHLPQHPAAPGHPRPARRGADYTRGAECAVDRSFAEGFMEKLTKA